MNVQKTGAIAALGLALAFPLLTASPKPENKAQPVKVLTFHVVDHGLLP